MFGCGIDMHSLSTLIDTGFLNFDTTPHNLSFLHMHILADSKFHSKEHYSHFYSFFPIRFPLLMNPSVVDYT